VKVTTERLEHCRVLLEVEVEPQRFESAADKVFQRLATQVRVPGFRQGKAPRAILRNFIGETRLRQEMLQTVIPEAYREAIREVGVEPMAEPDLEVVRMEQSQPLVFKATVPVKPVVELGDYRAIHIDAELIEISDEAIQQRIDQTRAQHVSWVPVERPARDGDQISGSLVCTADGTEVYGEESTVIELGKHVLPTEVEQGLVGIQTGEQRTLTVVVPEDFVRADVAGKEVTYVISVDDVKEKQLPSDDELVALVDDEESIEGMRSRFRGNLESEAQRVEAQRQLTAALEALSGMSKVDYPKVMVDNELRTMVRTFSRRIEQQGISFEQYLQMMGMTPAQYVERNRPQADRAVHDELLLEALANAEAIEPHQQAISDYLASAGITGQRPDLEGAVRAAIKRDRAVQWVRDNLLSLPPTTATQTTDEEPAHDPDDATTADAHASPPASTGEQVANTSTTGE